MSFRGRSFRPRGFPRPPRGGPPGPAVGRGNFRFPRPQSHVGHPTSSSRSDYPLSERTVFETRDKFSRTRSPDKEVCMFFWFKFLHVLLQQVLLLGLV